MKKKIRQIERLQAAYINRIADFITSPRQSPKKKWGKNIHMETLQCHGPNWKPVEASHIVKSLSVGAKAAIYRTLAQHNHPYRWSVDFDVRKAFVEKVIGPINSYPYSSSCLRRRKKVNRRTT